jgi:uncharacterized protein (TIRG00374 family)
MGLYIFAVFISTLRWKLIIPHHLPTKRLFSMYMIGAFFNHCLPGIVGGDAVKAYYLSRELTGQRSDNRQQTAERMEEAPLTVAIASVFMDRYIGFSALLFVSMAVIPFGLKYLDGTLKWQIAWIIPSVFVVFLVSSIVIFKFRIGERLKFLYKVYEYFQLYSSKKDVLIKAFLYSIVIQFSGIVSIYILSRGISLNIPFISLLIFVPIIILISFIPISISGIGLREGAFVFFLGTIGVSPALSVALSILWFLSVVVASLWGFLEYLRFKSMFSREEKQESL